MMARVLGAIAAVAGLALAPLAADAQMVMVSGCGTADRMLVVPVDPATPGRDDRGCAKACHAASDRRGKSRSILGCCR